LIYHCNTRDVVIVHINPLVRCGVPITAADILNRINEISFNSSLMREMRDRVRHRSDPARQARS
jgi:NTE family protein